MGYVLGFAYLALNDQRFKDDSQIRVCLFIYLFLAALGLRCCAWAFCSCSERGLLFVAVHGLLIAVASLVVEHGL